MRTLIALLCLLTIQNFSHAEEEQPTENDITVAEAASAHQAKGLKCEPNYSTAVGIVVNVEEGAEPPVMISPISVKSTYTLSKGAPVLWNSKIVTSRNSSVFILLSDNTTLKVGPNSQIKMDSFVYDPCKIATAGEMFKGFTRVLTNKLNSPNKPTEETKSRSSGLRG